MSEHNVIPWGRELLDLGFEWDFSSYRYTLPGTEWNVRRCFDGEYCINFLDKDRVWSNWFSFEVNEIVGFLEENAPVHTLTEVETEVRPDDSQMYVWNADNSTETFREWYEENIFNFSQKAVANLWFHIGHFDMHFSEILGLVVIGDHAYIDVRRAVPTKNSRTQRNIKVKENNNGS